MENQKNHLDSILRALAAAFRTSIFNEGRKKPTKLNEICYAHKGYSLNTADSQGQYGYYINEHATSYIYDLIQKYSIKSFLDLGCGVGHLIWLLKAVTRKINFVGYEIEQELIDYASKELFAEYHRHKGDSFKYGDACEIYQQDILNMNPKEVKKFDVLYFYEPFYSDDLAEKFVNHLKEVMKDKQLIFYTPAGYIRKYLEKSSCFEKLESTGPVIVYQFKKLRKTKNKSQDV